MQPKRRTLLLGALVSLASVAALSAHADEKGDRILHDAFRKLHQAQTMTADLTVERTITGQPGFTAKGTVALKKPNLLNVTLSSKAGIRTMKQTFVSDGTNYYTEGANNYMRQQAPRTPTEFSGEWEGELDSFFGGEANADKVNADFAGTETLDSIPCDLIRVTSKQQGDNRDLTYAIGQKDRLIHRTSWTTKLDDKVSMTQTNRLQNIKLNGPAAPSLFAFVAPKGVTLYDPEVALREMEKKLVPVGEEAPAFELTDPKTKTRFSLANVRDGRKAVLVNFWFYG